jgi:hypothetical protein
MRAGLFWNFIFPELNPARMNLMKKLNILKQIIRRRTGLKKGGFRK